jgi:hypothetical protein
MYGLWGTHRMQGGDILSTVQKVTHRSAKAGGTLCPHGEAFSGKIFLLISLWWCVLCVSFYPSNLCVLSISF